MSSVNGTTGLPIDQLITKNQTTPTNAVTNQLGADAFLQLLTTQLKNQNPLNPVDQTQSIAQLAQFSALQATTQLKDAFTAFQSNFSVMQSAGLIGRNVSAQTTDSTGSTSTVTGTVKTISVINGVPEFTMVDKNGNLIKNSAGVPLQIPTSAILSIG